MSSKPTKILIVDDVAANRILLGKTLESDGYDVLLVPNGETALRIAQQAKPSLIILDVMMPGLNGFEICRRLKKQKETKNIPVIFITAMDDTQSLIEGFKAGGVDYITRPFQEEEVRIRIDNHLRLHYLTQELREKNRQLQNEISRREQAEGQLAEADERLEIITKKEAQRWGIDGFLSQSPTLSAILNDVRQLQHAEKVSVLITGESGTGKELIARAIHFGSLRSQKPFIPLNCSAIPHELAESILFGHLQGSFTGATNSRKGYFELANGGTLFLDEIGDMPFELQAKLLRVLEDGRYIPVGGREEQRSDVRIISATNQNLQAQIAQGKFRQDFFFRLAQFMVEVPPLRERIEDIPLLAHHFLQLFTDEMGRKCPFLTDDALETLKNYHFPGNVRELKNIMEHAIIKSGGADITPKHMHLICQNIKDQPERDYTENSNIIKDEISMKNESANNGESCKEIFHSSAIKPNFLVDYETDEEKILAYVKKHGAINNMECRRLLSTDFHHASYLLKKLNKFGYLETEGERRWMRYSLSTSKGDAENNMQQNL